MPQTGARSMPLTDLRVTKVPAKAIAAATLVPASTVMARATDDRGRTQPDTPAWNPSGYLYNVPDRVQAGKLEPDPELAKALPAGEGQKIAAGKCAACHDETLIVGQRLDPVRWTREVEKMMRWGSPVTEQEKDVLARYLAEHFR